nr:MAG TPA: hypothetical protein [Caudoviricetes sp.]
MGKIEKSFLRRKHRFHITFYLVSRYYLYFILSFNILIIQ